MKLHFLGTGAADWLTPIETGEYRRYTSTQIDDALLIDYTGAVDSCVARSESVEAVLITHSHRDHFDREAIERLKPARLYVHKSWAADAKISGIETIPVSVGEAFDACGFRICPLPANHTTDRTGEVALNYLLEKDGKRLLYATDGAWLLKRALLLLGEEPLDGIVIDATIGDGHEGDYRIFEHNSLPMLRIMADTFVKTGRLAPGGTVYLTHLAQTLHPDHETLAKSLKAPLVPCHDGMEVSL